MLLSWLFGMPRDEQLLGPILLAAFLGAFWFAVVFGLILCSLSRRKRSDLSNNTARTERKATWRMIAAAAVIACVWALSAWTGLFLNDEILDSRSLPWIAPLITVQHFGFRTAGRQFPCQAEGSDKGCQPYKWIPAFLAANSLAYFPFALIGLFSFQHWEAARKIAQAAARRFPGWCIAVASTGLVTLQVMRGLKLATYDSLYPHPGVAHWHFGLWEQVNDITGTLVVIAGLLIPLYFYWTVRGGRGFAETRSRLAELTSLTMVVLVATVLVNPY